MPAKLLDVVDQLVFYGAYHSNKVNVRIHMICVPILIWTFQIVLASIPPPSVFPHFEHTFNSALLFKPNWAIVQASLYLAYYYLLFPTAAFIYTPQSILSVLSATAVAQNPENLKYALALHVVCWIAQFYGHGVHERRSPALLDNLIGAIVLAPFFVHLELLFECGYFSGLHKDVRNGIGKEVAKFRRDRAQAKREN
ncbi:hypothetical protein PNOK_0313800 [Pyrrhoderma noxium]|uniref:Uncharacterized protein n=1 Tax=Pyrrhoderma noxium TaxID=2282107 RepID=A0A286ULM3_9AGAM|nr:hypothetical protein PNOK_0313800 [Pyrrhoderma noxium]